MTLWIRVVVSRFQHTHFKKITGDFLQQAAVFKPDIFDPCGLKGGVLQVSEVCGENERFNATSQLLSLYKGIIARCDKGTAVNYQTCRAGIFTEINLRQMGLVFEGGHADPCKRIFITEINAYKAVTGFGNLRRGILKWFFKRSKNIGEVIIYPLALRILSRLAFFTVGCQKSVRELCQLAVILQREILYRDTVERTFFQCYQACRQLQIFDNSRYGGIVFSHIGKCLFLIDI